MAYKIPVMLTLAQVKALSSFPSADPRYIGVVKAANESLTKHNDRVREAENLLARVRDNSDEE